MSDITDTIISIIERDANAPAETPEEQAQRQAKVSAGYTFLGEVVYERSRAALSNIPHVSMTNAPAAEGDTQ